MRKTMYSYRSGNPDGYLCLLHAILGERWLWELEEIMAKCLTDREREILILRFGIQDKPLTYAQIGTKFNLSRERIRQIEAKALRKLRYPKYSNRFRFTTKKEIADIEMKIETIIQAIKVLTKDMPIEKKRMLIPDIPIENLELSAGAMKVLKNYGIRYSTTLAQKSELELLKLRNMGRKRLTEISKALNKLSIIGDAETD